MQDIGSKELATAWPKLQHSHSGQLQEGTIPVPLLCAYGMMPRSTCAVQRIPRRAVQELLFVLRAGTV